ncbi:DNA binding methylated-DNA--cysteine S-methyltransferase [Bimuria novae-zelandiae CBS 107.79]|uniref:Methylated-DNA--protein-cysteine methyltransferase n=1 Tax=Bimuria novae-zelandiae CBS 107.79 TaxID=1447943 RepID=A0A6A5UPV2_9PLEO|nr:DNA binding methylated-DNA--cysteine S-methyltransferase [Bimuria novae-zelandiae CBS 107.79]
MSPKTLPPGNITPFQSRVYALLLQIPEGKVTTYAALATALQSSPRAIGGALGKNPFAPEVPCHRVLASTGFIGGFKGEWEKGLGDVGREQSAKKELLAAEGVVIDERGYLADQSCWWDGFVV